MKPNFRKRFLTALNAAVLDAANAVNGMWQELELQEGEKETRYRLAKYGEFPVTVDGVQVTQVIDRECGELLASNFGSLRTLLATFGKGVPVYEGHADDPDWLRENPGHKAIAKGRIKAIENGEDGIYVRTVFNSGGVELLSGEAPAYSGHSPRWRMNEVEGRPGHFRPFILWSDALTNTPNMHDSHIALNSLATGMPQNIPAQKQSQAEAGAGADTENQTNEKTEDMKLTADALKALGFAPDAEPSGDEISAAIVKAMSAKMDAEKKPEEKPENIEALNTARIQITDLQAIRDAAVEDAVNAAVTSGRITEADKPKWKTALNTSFLSEKAKLDSLMPTAINTANHMANLGDRREGAPEAGGIDAINSAVGAIAREKGYDITTHTGYHAAYEAAKAAKPELFKRG